MAKKTRSPGSSINSSNAVKPLTKRPLDLIYYIFFIVHFIGSLLIDLLPLWPDFTHTTPGFQQLYTAGQWITAYYLKISNDPFILVNHGMVVREWEFAFFKFYMWLELSVSECSNAF